MANEFYIKQNDTSPSLAAILRDANGDAIDLTGATVVYSMQDKYSQILVNEQPVVITDAVNGTVRYDWQAGDTVEVGELRGEFEVTFNNGRIQTFPNAGHITINVTKELG